LKAKCDVYWVKRSLTADGRDLGTGTVWVPFSAAAKPIVEEGAKRLGVAAPRIHVGGLNPHAGESGLFGREEIEIIKPAINEAAGAGINVSGPFGADTMFHRKDCDAFIVMLHDQGHITAKLLARNATAGLAIGSPILFSSVAHGSGHDIVGKGVADPTAMIEAISRLARANHSLATA
jgi:4-hydroxy-L-threonine phosphate dehydrogenase PdxA